MTDEEFNRKMFNFLKEYVKLNDRYKSFDSFKKSYELILKNPDYPKDFVIMAEWSETDL